MRAVPFSRNKPTGQDPEEIILAESVIKNTPSKDDVNKRVHESRRYGFQQPTTIVPDIQEITFPMVVVYSDSPVTPRADKADPRERPKRPVSEAKWAANSVNASRSHGATSTAGKARAALNAVTHGATSNTIIFLKDESPEEFYAQVNRWVVELNAVTAAEYACIEMAVYNLWKMRRARNATAVAINEVTDSAELVYYQRQHARLLELFGMIPSNPRAAFREIGQMTQGVKWMLIMLEQFAGTLQAVATFDAQQRTELARLFGLEPLTLCSNREVVRFLFDLLALEYPAGTLTAARAAELLAAFKPNFMTVEDFQVRLEPHIAGMMPVEETREYLKLAIAKRTADLTDVLPLLKAHDEQEIAKAITLAQCDISKAGQIREQNEGRAEAAHFRSLRGLHALQNVRRKFGAGDPDQSGGPPEPDQPEHAASGTMPEAEPPAAPAAGDAPAAEVKRENDPTVAQAADEAKGCGTGPLQPDPAGSSQVPGGFAGPTAMMADCDRRIAEEKRLE
jgi:hypothetical protein